VIPIKTFSASSIGCHESCPMKHFISYFLKIRDKSNFRTDMGNICHTIWEIVALAKYHHQQGDKEFSPKFNPEWTFSTDYENLDINEIIDLVYFDWIENNPIPSQARGFKFDHWNESMHQTVKEWTYKVIGTDEDPRNFNIVRPELKFEMKIEEPWAAFSYIGENGEIESGHITLRGIIDLVYIDKNGLLCVKDYKTGARKDWNKKGSPVKDYKLLQEDIQLILYYYAAKKILDAPDDMTVEVHYINDGGIFPVHFSDNDVKNVLLHTIRKKFEEIKGGNITLNKSWQCKSFCFYGKNTFSDIGKSNVSTISDGRGHLTKQGEERKICEAVYKYINERPIELVIERCKA